MGKKKRNNRLKMEVLEIITDSDIIDSVSTSVKRSGANILLARAFPDIRDGLKPVQRRILVCIYNEIKNFSKLTKVSKIIGDTMGNYHPHGDNSITDTLVKMANEWEFNYPLIKKHGNFGSPMGDPHAEMRYINANISEFAIDAYFSEWTENITDFKLNYLGTKKEPEYLPSKYPMILINGSLGIGYGFKNEIPPYNFTEICESTIKLIRDKDASVKLYPDSPNKNKILLEPNGKDDNFTSINEYGKGKFKMRAWVNINKQENNTIIHITSVPYRVTSDRVLLNLRELVRDKKINGIKNIYDISKGTDIVIDIEVKNGYDANDILNKIYKSTSLEYQYNIDIQVIDNYKLRLVNPTEIIQKWIETRRITKRRILNYKYSKKRRRFHLLETILFVIDGDNAENTLSMIRKMKNKNDIINKLIKEYKITDIQAESISNMTFNNFSKDSIKRYKEEKKSLKKEIARFEELLTNPSRIDDIIISELEDGIKKWGRPRRAKLTSDHLKNHIANINYSIIITKEGYIKKLPLVNGNGIGKIKKGDVPISTFSINNRDSFIVFTKNGKMFRIETNNIPVTEKTSNGYLLENYIKTQSEIVSVIPSYIFDLTNKQKMHLVTVTRGGIIKKTDLLKIKDCSSGVSVIKLVNDELVDIKIASDNDNIILFTVKGEYTRYNLKEVNETNRVSKGVKAIKLNDNDYINGTILDDNKDYIAIFTDKGLCKKIPYDNIAMVERYKNSSKLTKLVDNDSIKSIISVNDNDNVVVYMKNKKITINVKDIPKMSRISKGKKLIPVPSGEVIIDVRNEIKS